MQELRKAIIEQKHLRKKEVLVFRAVLDKMGLYYVRKNPLNRLLYRQEYLPTLKVFYKFLPRERVQELGEEYSKINPVYNKEWRKKDWLKHLNKVANENQ